ncbi:MAG: ABC transporter substrate-binding protein [Candidatus Eremiobacteraeota bacterium]|nr:ABC transporter substrate-binding protein [Candidatus Eremiobacteraeota bacterium]
MTFARVTAALLLTIVGFVGCSGGTTSTSGSTSGATLVVARVKDAVTLDPAVATDGLSLNLTQEVLKGLVQFKPGSFDVEPAIASRWTMSPDGKTWTFTLKPGLRFSDGTPVNAESVKFNFDRWRLVSNPYHGNFVYGYYADMFGGFPGLVSNVKTHGANTVVLQLARAFGPFLRDLAMPSFAIGSPDALRKDEQGFAQRPVGYGPYTFTEWVKDDHITLQANPTWQGTKPTYQTVIIRDLADPSTAVLSLQKGDIDILTDPGRDDAKRLAAQSGITVYQQPSNNLMYMAMNIEKSPFEKLAVRQAIAYAVNLPAIVKAFYDGGGMVANNWTPPSILGENSAVKAYPYDPAKAKQLLAKAGLPNGFSSQLFYTTAPRPYMPEPQRTAEAIQADLKKVGINLTLEPFEWGVFLDKIRNGEHPMCLIGWSGDNGDPDDFMYPLLDRDSAHKPTAQNYSFWRDPNFHNLMLAGQATINDAQRASIYRQANALIHAQVPALAMVHTTVPIAMKSSITGFDPNPDTHISFELLKPKS